MSWCKHIKRACSPVIWTFLVGLLTCRCTERSPASLFCFVHTVISSVLLDRLGTQTGARPWRRKLSSCFSDWTDHKCGALFLICNEIRANWVQTCPAASRGLRWWETFFIRVSIWWSCRQMNRGWQPKSRSSRRSSFVSAETSWFKEGGGRRQKVVLNEMTPGQAKPD